MAMQRNELHTVHDRLGAAERVPLAGLDVRGRDALRAPEERLRIFRCFGGDFGRKPKVAFDFRDVDIGVRKDAISVLGGEASDVIGVEVRNQNKIDLFRSVARATQTIRHPTESSPSPPRAGACIDEDQLLARVDQEARVAYIQQVRILMQRFLDVSHHHLLSVQPMRFERASAIV